MLKTWHKSYSIFFLVEAKTIRVFFFNSISIIINEEGTAVQFVRFVKIFFFLPLMRG